MNARQPLPEDTAFNEDSRPEPSVEFDFDAVKWEPSKRSNAEDSTDVSRQEIMWRLVQWLATDASALEAGRRVLIIEYLKHPQGRTQRQLAKKLKMDEAALSRKIKTLRHVLGNGDGAT